MDVAKFLSDLNSELEQIEQGIRVWEREAGTRCEVGFEPVGTGVVPKKPSWQ